MADDEKSETAEEKTTDIQVLCVGCGRKDQLTKPFKHEDAGAVFWCAACGTLINAENGKIEGLVPRLTSAAMFAITGNRTTTAELSQEEKKASNPQIVSKG